MGSSPGKIKLDPTREDRLKYLTLNRKEGLSVAERLGLGRKRFNRRILYYRERQKHTPHSRDEVPAPSPSLLIGTVNVSE